jgi:hypothetical protein
LCYISSPSHPLFLDHSDYIFAKIKTMNTSSCSFVYGPVTSSLLGPNILLSTLFSNTLSLCSSINFTDQFSHPYKTTGNIMLLLILFFTFIFLLVFNFLLISSWIKLWFVTFIPKYLNCATFPKDMSPIFMSRFCSASWWEDSNILWRVSGYSDTNLPRIRVSASSNWSRRCLDDYALF